MKPIRLMLNKKVYLAVGICIAISILLVFLYINFNHTNKKDSNIQNTTLAEHETINYVPATKEDQEESDNAKNNSAARANNQSTPSTANVVITDASQYGQSIEIRALVTNVFAAGTCTITLSQEGNHFSKQVPATKDATTTQCQTISIPRSSFNNPGKWRVVVNYNSDSISGFSEKDLVIQ